MTGSPYLQQAAMRDALRALPHVAVLFRQLPQGLSRVHVAQCLVDIHHRRMPQLAARALVTALLHSLNGGHQQELRRFVATSVVPKHPENVVPDMPIDDSPMSRLLMQTPPMARRTTCPVCARDADGDVLRCEQCHSPVHQYRAV
jgi:predicted component of type VI protein secretion system